MILVGRISVHDRGSYAFIGNFHDMDEAHQYFSQLAASQEGSLDEILPAEDFLNSEGVMELSVL